MNARRGLKKVGLRSYLIEGPAATIVIEREANHRFSIRHHGHHPSFFLQRFRRLSAARLAAEYFAGAIPYFLDRRNNS